MSRNLLITGASGFIGSHLVEAARAAGYTVFAAVRPASRVEHLQHADINFLQLDYSSVPALEQAMAQRKITYVIHAAGVTKGRGLQAYSLVNAEYTLHLAKAARAAGVKKFVFLSSLAATGPAPDGEAPALTEESPARPVTDYGRSKLLAEQLLATVDGLTTVVLRPTAVYGPREQDLLIMLRTLNRGLEPYIGRAPQVFSFVHGTDLAKVAVATLEGPATGVFNIADGQAYDRYAFAAIAKEALDRSTLKLHVPLPVVKVIARLLERVSRRKTPALNREKLAELTAPGWQCSIDKARRELDFRPAYNLESGLRQTIDWYRDNEWL